MRSWLFTFLTLLTMMFQSNGASALRAIPDDHLAVAVLVNEKSPRGGGSGSGFYLTGNHAIWLVTARHVLWPDLAKLPKPPTDPAAWKLDNTELELLSYTKGY